MLSWKGIAEIGLEKMAAEQDLMIINAEQKLENLQEAVCKPTQRETQSVDAFNSLQQSQLELPTAIPSCSTVS